MDGWQHRRASSWPETQNNQWSYRGKGQAPCFGCAIEGKVDQDGESLEEIGSHGSELEAQACDCVKRQQKAR
jgi:hypothetical protein